MQFGGTRGKDTIIDLLGTCGGTRGSGTIPDLLRKFCGFQGRGNQRTFKSKVRLEGHFTFRSPDCEGYRNA